MFCPNCGTQNDSAATPCKKCGFKLSGVSAPKFKGTMVLNSDQTVQELIEEHRRRQAPGGPGDRERRASEPPPPSSGSAPPSASVPAAPRAPVLQPPRAAAGARRRMGGTMLGVAPQAGGLLPPEVKAPVRAAPPAPAPVERAPEPLRDETPGAEPPVSSGPADPLAGTAAMPVVEPALEVSPPPAPAEEAAAAEAPLAEASDDAVEPARPARSIPDTAPIPRQRDARAPSAESGPGHVERLSPLDIVLIIVTLGLYGIVIWARQRKPRA